MKKILIFVLYAATVLPAAAQKYKANIFGIRGGLNASMLTTNLGNGLYSYRRAKLGWIAGVSDQILLSRRTPFYLETGLYLSNKGGGYRYIDAATSRTVNIMYGATYLQVPLKINYHFWTGDITLEPYFGFHYSHGLWGRVVQKTTGGNIDMKKETTDLYSNRIFRRPDVGIMLGLGGTWNDLYFGLGWEAGFLNLSLAEGGRAFNSSVFQVIAGYNF